MGRKTLITYLIDESGSMSGVTQETIDGFNSYVNRVKKEKGQYITLTTFDSGGIRTPFLLQKAKNMPQIDTRFYQPRGLTPLYDAIGETIKKIDSRLKDFDAYDVVLFIQTDGYENASSRYTLQKIKKMIKKRKKRGWTITFLGADLDARAMASDFGIDLSNVKSYSKADTSALYNELATRTISYSNMSVHDKVAASQNFMASTDLAGVSESVVDITTGTTSAQE